MEKEKDRISLVVQRLRIHLPMQRTQLCSLVKDAICCGAAKPVGHDY